MWPVVIAIIAVVAVIALLAFRWFARYRYTDRWRRGEFRGIAFGMLMWFGGIFGHRVPPPPQAKVEFASGRSLPGEPPSGSPTLPDDTPHKEQ